MQHLGKGIIKFDRESFIFDYFSFDWKDLLQINELNADNSTQIYLDKINMLSDNYAPLKRINKYKLKLNSKPWITLDLQKSISVKNKIIREATLYLKRNFTITTKKLEIYSASLWKKVKTGFLL